MAYTFRYPNKITLGGAALTDESRQPVQEDRDERSVKVDLASGRKKKFVKSVCRRWSISWENVGKNADETVDGKGGRDELRSISEGAGYITLVMDGGEDGDETYTVEVDNYSEEELMRRGPGGFRYRITLDLTEQG